MDIFGKFKEIVFDVLEPSICEKEIVPEAKFIDDLGADRLDRITIVMSAENLFGIKIPDKDADDLETIGQAVDCITKRLAEKESVSDFQI